MRDVHLVELFKQLGLDMKKDIHLLLPIEDFVRQKEKKRDVWQFRVKPDGSKYWVHQFETVTKFEYPYLEELDKQVKFYQEKYAPDTGTKFLKDYNPLQVVLSSPALLDKAKRCKESTIRVLEDYFRLQYNDGQQEGSLRNRLIEIKAILQQLLTINIDLHEFITLVFFCEFDLEKFVIERQKFEKNDEAYLKSMNPNLEFNDKIEQIRIKEKRKAARIRHSGVYTDSEGSVMGRTAYSQASQLVRGASFFEELGPAENYTHLFDQDLKNGNVPFISDKTKKLIHELDTIGELSTVLEECRSLISKSVNEINEEYLEKLLLDVRRLYRMIEKNDSEGSQSSLEALNKIQANIIIKKKQLETQKEHVQEEQRAKELANLLAIERSLNKGLPADGVHDEKQSSQDLLQRMHTKRSDGDLAGSQIFEESAGKDLSDANPNRTKGTLDDLRKVDLTHPESAQEGDSQRSQAGILDQDFNRAKSLRTTPAGGISPVAGTSPNSRNVIRFLSKENLNQLEMYMKVLKEGETIARLDSPRSKTLKQLEEVTQEMQQKDLEIKELQIIRKELQQMKPSEKRTPGIYKVVDRHGRIVESQQLAELEQRWRIIRKDTDEESLCSDDETIIYEEVNQGSLRRKRIKKAVLLQIHKEAIKRVESQIVEKETQVAVAEFTREVLTKRVNLFDQFLADMKSFSANQPISERAALKPTAWQRNQSNMFSRVNNNLPTSLKEMPDLRSKVEQFILVWLGQNLKLAHKDLIVLVNDAEKRSTFFSLHCEVYNLVLETLLKRPHLYAKVKSSLYAPKVLTSNLRHSKKSERTISSITKIQDSALEQTMFAFKETSKSRVLNSLRESVSQFPKLLETSRGNLGGFENSGSKDFVIISRSKQNYYSNLRTGSNFFMHASATPAVNELARTASTGWRLPKVASVSLESRFGGARNLTRTILNSFPTRPSLEAIPDIQRWAIRLGIQEPTLEGDLYWVAILAYLVLGSTQSPAGGETARSSMLETSRHFSKSSREQFAPAPERGTADVYLSYFVQVLQHQRHRRKMAEHSLPKDVFDSVCCALSWAGFDDRSKLPVFYNFRTGVQVMSILSRDIQLMTAYHNYLPNK